MEAPVAGQAARRSRTPSLLHSPARPGSIEGLLQEQEGDFAQIEDRPLSRASSAHPSGSGIALEPGLRDTESLKFLNYAKRQRAALPSAGDQTLLFSDIVPVSDTNASTASQAMYHLLCLATKGLVKVAQDEPYGEIAVDIV
ncbi:hypothetical protein Rhopal_004713-T1 [Rhodotorula paludigena]|uniref:Rad21/Rec8-like protein C-terminal eukaryotic domain-containing protein n=1 Tax=Rhodotorula paludigena TaxID=86838 RepID=A0AAV5GP72_9BASI|nr:hypothetical protein Rhopal_004713-T1 [Rhodotorula paludigena]